MVLLDAVFVYMFNRALQKGIDFDLILGSNLSGITSIITQAQLETLTADLVENAIIATEHSGDRYKSIYVYFWVTHGAYELCVDDSGESFEIDIIIQLGKRRVTTHADKGGSGIGFMSVFEILRLCGASLIITERPAIAYQHSKSVAVRFDGKNQKVICSYRAEGIALNNDGSWMIEDFDEKTYHQGDMKF